MAEAGPFADWASVAEVGQVYEAELIALRLREAEIEAEIIDQGSEEFPIPASTDFERIRVMVPAAKAAAARQLLEQPVTLPEDGESES
jgi:hypothetical protein